MNVPPAAAVYEDNTPTTPIPDSQFPYCNWFTILPVDGVNQLRIRNYELRIEIPLDLLIRNS